MKYFLLKVVLLLPVMGFIVVTHSWASQSDTVKVQHVNVAPVIDGMDSDECWNSAGVSWQPIDQVWMPWKGTVPASSDFTGKYKVVWNETENLMYFLVDVVDDRFIDGYDFASNGPYGYPNYDVVEIFLDENRSQGGHVFDNGSENAQNALSYHISVNSPEDGETTDQFTVEDLDGVSWSNSWVVNYASHFPSFRMKKNGDHYLYEFSLMVYNDSYPTQQKNGSTPTDVEMARVKLTAGKIMGASIAYCDNDDNDGKRDHFFGSTPGKEYTANFGFSGTQNSISNENGQKIFNTNWMSANDYGVFMLMSAGVTASSNLTANAPKVTIVMDKASGNLNIFVPNAKTGKVIIDIYTFSGSKVAGFMDQALTDSFTGSYNLQLVTPGIYLVKVSVGGETYVKKIFR